MLLVVEPVPKMKIIVKIAFVFCLLSLNLFSFAQKVQIKALPKVNLPKVTKVHVNSNSIIVSKGNIKTDKKKEEITEVPKEPGDDKKRKKKE